VCCLFSFSLFADEERFEEEFSEDYGVDITAPIHHYLNPKSYFGKRYDKMIGGCFSKFSKKECKGNEDARLKYFFPLRIRT
jgi:hypothetical protein